MSDRQRACFDAEMAIRSKDRTAAVLLALFLGGIGAHHFYFRAWMLGVLYILFCWTFIPSIVAFVEVFFQPARVRRHNAQEARRLAAQIQLVAPADAPARPA